MSISILYPLHSPWYLTSMPMNCRYRDPWSHHSLRTITWPCFGTAVTERCAQFSDTLRHQFQHVSNCSMTSYNSILAHRSHEICNKLSLTAGWHRELWNSSNLFYNATSTYNSYDQFSFKVCLYRYYIHYIHPDTWHRCPWTVDTVIHGHTTA